MTSPVKLHNVIMIILVVTLWPVLLAAKNMWPR